MSAPPGTPKASEAAVAAVQDALGCWPFQSPECAEGCDWCNGEHCSVHGSDEAKWTGRGCPIAVKAADAVVTADDDKRLAKLEAWQRYKVTHDAYGRPAETYPDNRDGRRALARTWKNVPPGIYHRGGEG